MDVREAYAHYLSTHFGGAGRPGHDNFLLQERYFRKNYLSLLPQRKDARIIDLGCGLGHFLFFLQRAGYTNILGVDVGKEVIAFCRRKDFPVVEAELHEFLDALREPVDAFVLNDVLEHQPKATMWTLLERMRQRLVPHGVVLLKVPNMGNPLLGADSRYLDITHAVGYNQNSLKQVLLMAGFVDVTVTGLDIYVAKNPLTNLLARTAARLLNGAFLLLFRLYGRTETTIFGKNILAIARMSGPARGEPPA